MTTTNTNNTALNQEVAVPTLEGAARDIVQSLDSEDLEMRHTDLPHVPVVVMLHASRNAGEVPVDINPALARFAQAVRALEPQACAPDISLVVGETVIPPSASSEDFALPGGLGFSDAGSLVSAAHAARTELQMRRLLSAIYGVGLATPIVFLLADDNVSDDEALATFRDERLAESFHLVTLPLGVLGASLGEVADTIGRLCEHDPSRPLDDVLG